MLKKRIWVAFFASAAVFAAILCIFIFSQKQLLKTPDAPLPPTGQYIIKEYMGKLAVFSTNDEQTPTQVLEVYVRTLPLYDRDRLTNGIIAADEKQLRKLLEDYAT